MARGVFISEQELVSQLRLHRLVLLGEKHDNRRHHLLQARLLRGLVLGNRRPAVAWEMITAGEQKLLAGHLRRHPGDAAGLGAALRWKAR